MQGLHKVVPPGRISVGCGLKGRLLLGVVKPGKDCVVPFARSLKVMGTLTKVKGQDKTPPDSITPLQILISSLILLFL
jgi:hypothetical protein